MGSSSGEGGLRRRMPLRRSGAYGSGGGGGSGSGGGGGGGGGGDSFDSSSCGGLTAVCSGGVGGATSALGGRAMRYYRLWIYTCNTALLAGALAFMGAAARTLLFDYRRTLIPSLTLYEPSFLYAYLALATQGGALQLLGCVAAVRLSERLLNAYWVLLLVLLFGDLVIGAFWAFRFERVCQELRPALRMRWKYEYGTNPDLTGLWDRLQTESSCCGVAGPSDYGNDSKWEMPASCCAPPVSVTSAASAAVQAVVTNTTSAAAAAAAAAATTTTTQASIAVSGAPSSVVTITVLVNSSTEVVATAGGGRCLPYPAGCDEKLVSYLRATASVLAILGYCVLAFLKICFLGILRYEIREMIQKIRILRAELELVPSGVNGGVPGTACSLRVESAESERESLLLVRPDSAMLLSSPPQPIQPHHQQILLQQHSIQSSHMTPIAASTTYGGSNPVVSTTTLCGSSGNILTTTTTTSIAPTSTKTPTNPNGNNNYEILSRPVARNSHDNI